MDGLTGGDIGEPIMLIPHDERRRDERRAQLTQRFDSGKDGALEVTLRWKRIKGIAAGDESQSIVGIPSTVIIDEILDAEYPTSPSA